MQQITVHDVIQRLRDNYDPKIEDRLLNVYQLGSRVYGTAGPQSDWDFMVIVKFSDFSLRQKESLIPDDSFLKKHIDNENDKEFFLWECYDDGTVNCALYDEHYFEMMVREHRMEAIECISLPDKHIWMEKRHFDLSLDADILRKMATWISKLRLSMAKRRIDEEPYKAKKCVFHALRYLTFALQVIKHNKIVDYTEANHFLNMVMNFPSNSWPEISNKFKPYIKDLTNQLNAQSNNEFYTFFEIQSHAKVHVKELTQYNKICNFNTILATGQFVQKFGIWELCKNNKIRITCHSDNVLHLSTMIDSPQNEVTEECSQGIVVDIETGEILCFPCSPVFQDYKQIKNFPGNFSVYEAIDALLVTLYYHKNEWHVASKWDADGAVPMCWKDNSLKIPLSKLFWEIWGTQPLPTNTKMCYTFAMATNRQRIIVKYPQEKLYLVRVTDLTTLKSVDIEMFAGEYTIPKRFSFSSISQVIEACDKLNPFLQKGFDIVSQDFPTITIKSPQYVAVHSSILYGNPGFGPMNLNADNIEMEAMIELVRMGEAELFLQYFPRWEPMYVKVKKGYDEYIQQIESVFDKLEKITDQREFAVEAKGFPYSTFLFEMRKNPAYSPRELLSYTRNKSVLKSLDTFLLQ